MKELAQLKLIDGHEIVCEIIEWPEKNDDQVIIRNAMAIVVVEDAMGDNAYVFRPFVHFLDDEKDYVLLNSNHVMSMNRPKNYLSEQYEVSVQSMLQTHRERVAEYEQAKEEGLRQFEEAMNQYLTPRDSSDTNIIQFPEKDTLH